MVFRTCALLRPSLVVLLLLSGCSANNAKHHYILAEKLWNDQKYAASVSEFEKVLAKDAKGKLGLQATYRAAMTQAFFLSQYPEAIRKFRAYADMMGDGAASLEAQKHIGEILYSKMEQYDQVIQHYSSLLKQKPDLPEGPEFLFRIGKSQFFLGMFDDALKTYQELMKAYPSSTWAEKSAYEIGMTYFTRGEQNPSGKGPGMDHYQDAINAFERFGKKYPSSEYLPLARFGIASCLEELDQLDSAYQAYEALKGTYPAPKVIEIKLARIRERKAQRSR